MSSLFLQINKKIISTVSFADRIRSAYAVRDITGISQRKERKEPKEIKEYIY